MTVAGFIYRDIKNKNTHLYLFAHCRTIVRMSFCSSLDYLEKGNEKKQ